MILSGTKKILGLCNNRTFAVSIPKDWITHHGLNAKDKIEYLADEVLVYIPSTSKINREKLVDAIQQAKEE